MDQRESKHSQSNNKPITKSQLAWYAFIFALIMSVLAFFKGPAAMMANFIMAFIYGFIILYIVASVIEAYRKYIRKG